MIQAWPLPMSLPLFTQMQAPATALGQRLPAWSLPRVLSPILSLPPQLVLSSFLPVSILSPLHCLAVETLPSFITAEPQLFHLCNGLVIVALFYV